MVIWKWGNPVCDRTWQFEECSCSGVCVSHRHYMPMVRAYLSFTQIDTRCPEYSLYFLPSLLPIYFMIYIAFHLWYLCTSTPKQLLQPALWQGVRYVATPYTWNGMWNSVYCCLLYQTISICHTCTTETVTSDQWYLTLCKCSPGEVIARQEMIV